MVGVTRNFFRSVLIARNGGVDSGAPVFNSWDKFVAFVISGSSSARYRMENSMSRRVCEARYFANCQKVATAQAFQRYFVTRNSRIMDRRSQARGKNPRDEPGLKIAILGPRRHTRAAIDGK